MAEREEKMNPLLNELVIDSISKYLSFEELKVCRGLNHLWKKTTNKPFLKLCPPFYLQMDSKSDTTRSAGCHKRMRISEFLEIYSDPRHAHPFAPLIRQYRNFYVYSNTDEECERIPIFHNFMTGIGPQMTALKFSNVNLLTNSQDLVDMVSSKYTPKLEKLEIHLKEIDNDRQSVSERVGIDIEAKENKHLRRLCLSLQNNNKVPWLDVLSLYPNLKALSFEYTHVEAIQEIAIALVIIRKANETKLKLTEHKIFSIYISRGKTSNLQSILDLLETANLPLEKLSLDYTVSKISLELIENYKNGLKSLVLKNAKLPQPFPLMKTLEGLVVEDRDLTFLSKVPNLKSLCFVQYNYNHRDPGLQAWFPKSTPNPLLSLTKLHAGMLKEWNITEMEKLLLWMPNVQNLEMRLNNTAFSWICKYLPNLKELTVRGGKLDESGVVGEFDGAFEVEGCRVNITNLKALETFKMADCPLKRGLTEKSVFHGFCLMPKLSKLLLRVESKFSAEAMLALNRGIKNVPIQANRNLVRKIWHCLGDGDCKT